ncbi:3-dehydroquinate dehydratase [Persephonella hydrogeniphila]|uniref:3-dehydroquinate dehydratase n=1 Tax=Persephonella hydrogeniphila TaxID=198703 RepID=A0A285NLG5_9AQUI|nr:type I 3-dehydroquinate dehydratase [Persephonella hydrogeniphila]SNZ10374.1 3-dehydroquinate dehydratase [Persephonella hydrogeniphila]
MEKYPLVVLPADDNELEKTLAMAVDKSIDMIELRIDQFSNFDIKYIVEKAQLVKKYDFGMIATVRSKEEGGTDIQDEDRVKIFEAVVEYADILDIELTSKRINHKVIEIAKDEGKLSLVSYHDFEKTPEEDEIQKIIDDASALGADIIKYAFTVNSVEDVSRLMCVTAKNRDKKLVAIGMGELGRITRVAGFFFGSVLTYTYIGKSFAPGQIEAGRLIEELKFYGLRG